MARPNVELLEQPRFRKKAVFCFRLNLEREGLLFGPVVGGGMRPLGLDSVCLKGKDESCRLNEGKKIGFRKSHKPQSRWRVLRGEKKIVN